MDREKSTAIAGASASSPRWPTNAEEVVALLREIGLRRLMGSDGCNCGYVQVRGYHIDRSCHKSESSLRVYAQGGDSSPAELAQIATEALAQMRAEDGWSDILVRYCEYTHDHKGSGWVGEAWVRSTGICVYCEKPRDSVDDYLCAKCKGGELYPGYPIAPTYDYSGLAPHGLQMGKRNDP